MLTEGQWNVLQVLGLAVPMDGRPGDQLHVQRRPGAGIWRFPTDIEPDMVVKHLEAWLVVTPFGAVAQSLECCWCGGRDWYPLDFDPSGRDPRGCSSCRALAPHRPVDPTGRVHGG